MKKEQFCKIFSVAIFVLFFVVLTSHVSYAGDVANGQALYEGKCVICHGAGGTPVMPGIPVFSKGESLDKDIAVLKKSILEGVIPEGGMAPPMPPMQGQISDAEMDDLLAYIMSLKP
jgi:mono/diheme cytochrome c family protein